MTTDAEKYLEEQIKIAKKNPLPLKQYIRTTFRLHELAHQAISELSQRQNIKNAEVFDLLLDNLTETKQQLGDSAGFIKALKELPRDFLNVYRKMENKDPLSSDFNFENKVRRTYVVEKNTATKLKEMAEQDNVSRDDLVELVITFNAINKWNSEAERTITKVSYEYVLEGEYEDVQMGIEIPIQYLEEAADYMKENLGEDDSMLLRLSKVIAELRGLVGDMRAYITEEKAN